MHTPLTNFVDLINQDDRVLNLTRLQCSHNLARDCTHISSPETLQGRGVAVATQGDSVELSAEGGRNGLSYGGLTHAWGAHETQDLALH